MKNLLRLLTICFVTSLAMLSACKDDDEANPLIGTWIFKSEATTECSDSDFNGTESCSTDCDEIVITATTITDDTGSSNYTLDGNKIVISGSLGGVTFSVTVTYSISGNQLTITDETDTTFGCKTVTVFTKKS
ncbi:MAG: hypothetical protein AB7O48_04780 [Cyclobacteriaceae bacterium]